MSSHQAAFRVPVSPRTAAVRYSSAKASTSIATTATAHSARAAASFAPHTFMRFGCQTRRFAMPPLDHSAPIAEAASSIDSRPVTIATPMSRKTPSSSNWNV